MSANLGDRVGAELQTQRGLIAPERSIDRQSGPSPDPPPGCRTFHGRNPEFRRSRHGIG